MKEFKLMIESLRVEEEKAREEILKLNGKIYHADMEKIKMVDVL